MFDAYDILETFLVEYGYTITRHSISDFPGETAISHLAIVKRKRYIVDIVVANDTVVNVYRPGSAIIYGTFNLANKESLEQLRLLIAKFRRQLLDESATPFTKPAMLPDQCSTCINVMPGKQNPPWTFYRTFDYSKLAAATGKSGKSIYVESKFPPIDIKATSQCPRHRLHRRPQVKN